MINSNVSTSLGGIRFGTDGDGNYGYYGADGSLIPFKRGGGVSLVKSDKTTYNTSYIKGQTILLSSLTHEPDGTAAIIMANYSGSAGTSGAIYNSYMTVSFLGS